MILVPVMNFTKEELSTIMAWAMDAADKAKRSRIVNAYQYETAKAVFDKAFKEYNKGEG